MVLGAVLLLVILNDYMDFIKEKLIGQLIPKIIFTLIILGAFIKMKNDFSKDSDLLQDAMI
jgi:hypothetical protein